ncbi:MAG: PEP-CTERM sorting domain-containing protein [Planctomycetes bacterium]|nr:PEP-CTERM sorting domain-containing protein [Planctomycetota bacterium]
MVSLRTGLVAFVVFVGVSAAYGDGLFSDLYHGLDVLATPSGAPVLTTGDGTRTNGQRNGYLRILPDQLGKGYQLEFGRTFGGDTRGRPEILDLGLYELQLSGTMGATAAYTSRGLRIGNLDAAGQNINYSLRSKLSAQDFELSGTLGFSQGIEINEFGFYSYDLTVNNATSFLTVDGVLVRDVESTNFDLGPIAVEGNIFFDLTLALLSSLGLDTSGLEALSPGSPIDSINDAITQQLERTGLIAGEQFALDNLGDLFGPPVPEGKSIPVVPHSLTATLESGQDSSPFTIPEPGTLLLFGIGGAAYWGWRRR